MFGTNPVEGPTKGSDGKVLDIKEVFSTIQGEGPFAGMPATFIRLGGCHLACWFCDTDFTTNRAQQTIEELVSNCRIRGNGLVVLTGGEPMRQNIVPLCLELVRNYFQVQIETAGSFWPGEGTPMERALFSEKCHLGTVHIVVSPKAGYIHPQVSVHAQTWKYIVTLQDPLDADFLPVLDTQSAEAVVRPPARPPQHIPAESIYIQPCDQGHSQKEIWAKCVDICKKTGFRLSLQQHKLLGLP